MPLFAKAWENKGWVYFKAQMYAILIAGNSYEKILQSDISMHSSGLKNKLAYNYFRWVSKSLYIFWPIRLSLKVLKPISSYHCDSTYMLKKHKPF